MTIDAPSTEQPKTDILTIALFVAAVVHAIVILGISFRPILEEMRTPPALEVILVQQKAVEDEEDEPEEADYLAQTSQDGGGETDENTRPSSPFASEIDSASDGLASAPVLASAPATPLAPQAARADTILKRRAVAISTCIPKV